MNGNIRITNGFSEYQVFQRDDSGMAVFHVTGQAPDDANSVEVRLLKGNAPLPGFGWKGVCIVRDGNWQFDLVGVPTGGPYKLEIQFHAASGKRIAKLRFRHLLVGDIWVLGGQSNMEGCGFLKNVARPHEMVHSYDMSEKWGVAEEPLHWLAESVDPVHWPCGPEQIEDARAETRRTRQQGAGLALTFAKWMVEKTGVPIGLLPCAHGGTSMDQWSSDLKDRGGMSLYGSMLRRLSAAGGKARGMLWYQGESDAFPGLAEKFKDKMKRFIESVRADFGNPSLPFFQVQISRVIVAEPEFSGWNAIQEAQRQICDEVPGTALISAVDLDLDDAIHIGTEGHKTLGLRMAKAVCAMLHPQLELKGGPRLAGVKVLPGGTLIRVTYDGVKGKLRSSGRLTGFSIADSGGRLLPLVFRAEIETGSDTDVLLRLSGPVPEGACLWYGKGTDPCCNLTDSEGMAATVFGPIKLS